MDTLPSPRTISINGDQYDFNQGCVCPCSQSKDPRDAQLMYYNITKKRFECFWCGREAYLKDDVG